MAESVACLRCGTPNPDVARFCMACAAPLAEAPRRLGQERKIVTALFCDLVGSTEFADGTDPEDVDRLLRAYHAIAKRRIEMFGGSVEKFIGDAVVGIFGVPAAHEDDPERAIQAALRLVEEVQASGLGLHVRVGIMTGETLVHGDLDPTAGQGIATGDTLNIAARLQGQAEVDGVLVGDPTYRACVSAFIWQDIGPLALKGRTEPLHGWRPTGTVGRVRGAEAAETTLFVGRATELETLVRLFERSRQTPSLEVVTIVADPGLGKSRLVREFARQLDALPEPVTWRRGRCLAYGEGVGLWALGEIVAAHAGILETDEPAVIAAKLDAALVEPDPSLRPWMLDRLGPLVGLATGGLPSSQEETFTAWRRFLESIARTGPLVLVIEDLHWADTALVEFLLHVATMSSGLPITLVVTTRPEIEDRHPSWLARARRSTVLFLGGLADSAVAELLAASLPDAGPELLAVVLDRAAGSPLYADQLAAMLRDAPPGQRNALDEGSVPLTIQALLAARIDALPDDVKPALLDASVIGKSFWTGAVAHLGGQPASGVGPALADLVRRELARPAFPSTMEGDAEFAFWHALVRDVAYGKLPRAARLAKHRAAAEWIAARSGTRAAEIVVDHLTRGLEIATLLGDADAIDAVGAALVDALLVAADHAMWAAPMQSVGYLHRALERLPPGDARRVGALIGLGRALAALHRDEEARVATHEAWTLLTSSGDVLHAAALAPRLALSTANSGDAEGAAVVLEHARRSIADRPGPELVGVMAEQAAMAMRKGDHPVAVELGTSIIRLAEQLGLPPPPRALMAVGGDANYRRAIELADAAGDLYMSSVGRVNRVIHLRGTADEWLAAISDSIAFDTAHGLDASDTSQLQATFSFSHLGRPDGCAEALRSYSDHAIADGYTWGAMQGLLSLASLLTETGAPLAEVEAVLKETRSLGNPEQTFSPEALAGVALAQGDLEGARRYLAGVVEQLETGDEFEEPWLIVDRCLRVDARDLAVRAVGAGRWVDGGGGVIDPATAELGAAEVDANAGRLAEADGDLEVARACYERAIATFARYDWRTPVARIRPWLGRCLVRKGETTAGLEHLRLARDEATRIGLRPWVAEIDTLLAEAMSSAETSAGSTAASSGPVSE